jgi:hypothetical protein
VLQADFVAKPAPHKFVFEMVLKMPEQTRSN